MRRTVRSIRLAPEPSSHPVAALLQPLHLRWARLDLNWKAHHAGASTPLLLQCREMNLSQLSAAGDAATAVDDNLSSLTAVQLFLSVGRCNQRHIPRRWIEAQGKRWVNGISKVVNLGAENGQGGTYQLGDVNLLDPQTRFYERGGLYAGSARLDALSASA